MWSYFKHNLDLRTNTSTKKRGNDENHPVIKTMTNTIKENKASKKKILLI